MTSPVPRPTTSPSAAASPGTSPYSVVPVPLPKRVKLDDVERVALKTNDATRTLGVAFDGCTLPGADRPLFTVAQGTMGLGLGIHGEPGVSSHDMPTAADLAALLVDGVLAETPSWCNGSRRGRPQWAGPNHVRGTVGVWKTVAGRLAAAGLTLVQPEVGRIDCRPASTWPGAR